ncbi:helix-turn-helix domain-containing protein [Listeria booriae]|uniref:Helix-turn-helix domain-containing protein n=1 Tax=Listeria booriae TaxID=1552123 RepID=A0A842B107_9LIST|nr:helix-turn-helix transcriptional regulator [Listeria booriae]MBC1796059.1 helix-turn-helix domain-containing protein [Listeria booriae]MBC1800326.1 helix-turn-helix domain-containing protein [Listeria booriae]MBC1812895.1 helix-turn-helix domain-containing protein [Listeria booriae]
MNTFGDRLKSLRKKNKITQSELAKKLGISQVTISKYENNIIEPDNANLTVLAETFDTSIDYLLGRTNNPTSGESDNVSVHYFEKENLTDEDIEYIETMIEALKRKTRDRNNK